MGFNLCLVRWPADNQEPSYDDDDDRFDAFLRVGDREFIYWLMDKGDSREVPGIEPVFRPRNLMDAQAWIPRNIRRADSQRRLLALVDPLRCEPELWIDGSF